MKIISNKKEFNKISGSIKQGGFNNSISFISQIKDLLNCPAGLQRKEKIDKRSHKTRDWNIKKQKIAKLINYTF